MPRNTGDKAPPKGTQFQKGQSGNPKGRPRKKPPQQEPSGSAFDIVMDKTLTIMREGIPREVSVEEALQHKIYQQAIAGSRTAQRQVLKMIAKREKYLAAQKGRTVPSVGLQFESDPENAEEALALLGIVSPDPRFAEDEGIRAQKRLVLEPWAVQAALSRRHGGSRLTKQNIEEITYCTRDADKLRWPRDLEE